MCESGLTDLQSNQYYAPIQSIMASVHNNTYEREGEISTCQAMPGLENVKLTVYGSVNVLLTYWGFQYRFDLKHNFEEKINWSLIIT